MELSFKTETETPKTNANNQLQNMSILHKCRYARTTFLQHQLGKF